MVRSLTKQGELGFPLEWYILLGSLAVGLPFWFARAKPRAGVSEVERHALIFGSEYEDR